MRDCCIELPNVSVDGSSEETLCSGAAKVVSTVKKDWKPEELLFKVYTDGITNKLVGVYHKDVPKDSQLLVRVYGEKTENFIDRNAEKTYIKYLEPHGCGPTLFASFANGICYSYVPGVPLTTETVRTEKVHKAVAKHMAQLNSIPMLPDSNNSSTSNDSSKALLFNKMKSFLALLPSDFSTAEKLKLAQAANFTPSTLTAAYTEMESIVSELQCPLVLSHNDLLLANLLWQEENGVVRFIDFEYTAPNYQPYDIANHFCEFAGVDTVDYNLYPTLEFQRQWIKEYLSHQSSASPRPLDWWIGAVAVLSLCSHLFWGTWALVQAQNSTIDFDFAEYALIRLNEYKRKKEEFIKLGEDAIRLIKNNK